MRLGTTLEASEPRPPRQLELGARPRRGGWPTRFAEHPEAVAETAAPRRAAPLRPHRGARLPLPRRRGPRRRPRAGRGLPGAAGGALRAARRQPRRGRGAARAGAGDDPQPRPLRLLPPPPRPARAGPRGGARGARPRVGALGPAARPRPRLQRQLDRLLPDRPLPHRPGREGPLLRPLPQRGGRASGRRARHRPRLPARHPRGADPPRPRALRRRPLGPGRRLPDLPPARRVRDLGKALALPAEEIERVAKMVGFHERSGRDRARRGRRDRRRPRRLAAAGGRCSSSAARRWACPATPPSTRAGW